MSDTLVSLLTAPGTGAIATVQVCGPQAYSLAKQLFTPAGKPLPESPDVGRFYFGTLGSDEVVLVVTAADAVEVHCHGGPRVVRWVMDQFLASGGRQPPVLGKQDENRGLTPPARLLERAPTLRTAAILLDQLHGAFANEVRRILTLLESDPVEARGALYQFAELGTTVGRHLIEPWKVVVAGAPNVGKSSLVNALAGYQRAVVSEAAGTTRDAVSVRTAFDGWPVELIDTAGLREATALEAEGIRRAEQALAEADLIVWVLDLSDPNPVLPHLEYGGLPNHGDLILVANKADRAPAWEVAERPFSYNFRTRGGSGLELACWDRTVTATPVSAATGDGLATLVPQIVGKLVPKAPAAGSPVPYTPELARAVYLAEFEVICGRFDEAARLLREALASCGPVTP